MDVKPTSAISLYVSIMTIKLLYLYLNLCFLGCHSAFSGTNYRHSLSSASTDVETGFFWFDGFLSKMLHLWIQDIPPRWDWDGSHYGPAYLLHWSRQMTPWMRLPFDLFHKAEWTNGRRAFGALKDTGQRAARKRGRQIITIHTAVQWTAFQGRLPLSM